MRFGEDFKQFIGGAKSAMTFVRDATKLIEAAGFKPWPACAVEGGRAAGFTLVRGQPRPHDCRLRRSAREPLASGAPHRQHPQRFGASSGSSRRPFRESFDIALLDTTTHGGLKNYQWVNRPLAIIGRVTKTDGTERDDRHRPRAGRSGADHSRPGPARRPRLPRAEEPRRDSDRRARSDARVDPRRGDARS